MIKFNSELMITFNLELMIKFQQSKWSYCCVFWNIVSHKFDVLSCFVSNAHWNKGSKPVDLFNGSAGVWQLRSIVHRHHWLGAWIVINFSLNPAQENEFPARFGQIILQLDSCWNTNGSRLKRVISAADQRFHKCFARLEPLKKKNETE